MKSIVLFLVTFVVGAALALGVRTVSHDPHATPAPAVATPAADAPHAGHAASAAAANTVNTVCALCGMDVDPAIPAATYQGKLVGFGCAACPARFAKEPDRYGPSALRNEVVNN